MMARYLLLPGRWRANAAAAVMIAVLATLLYVPAALAFPYRAQFGATTVFADKPIAPVMAERLARADRLLAASPIDVPGIPRQVVLTDGGWRWRIMALGMSGAIALRRPFGNVLVFNRNDVAADRVWNGAAIAGERTLSGTIAHETTHMLIARRYGELAAWRLPTWKAEGYADHVAQETSVSDGDEARLRAAYPRSPALAYYEGRRRVAAVLARNGGSVDRLMTGK
jgi:hypothetical protein